MNETHMPMRKLRIAILGEGFISWGGGVDFLRLCIKALQAGAPSTGIELIVLIPMEPAWYAWARSMREWMRKGGAGLHLKRADQQPRHEAARASLAEIGSDLKFVFYRQGRQGLQACLKAIRAEVVLPAAQPLGSTFPFPWAGYLYDFQHKYLEHFFTQQERRKRDLHFARMLEEAPAVIVNSRSVALDIDRFFPKHRSQIFSLPFAPVFSEGWCDQDLDTLPSGYSLPKNFFLVSNQFHIHKSHETAFQALSLLLPKVKGRDVAIVCTGKMEDGRFPDYVGDLLKRVEQLGVRDNAIFLGHIPKADQLRIMRNARAVVQPTLFEGGPGGGAVYDAVALGVPAIVSDIPVNLEIEGEDVRFFKSGDADQLAMRMLEVLEHDHSRLEAAVLWERSQGRLRACGAKLYELVDFVRPALSTSSPLVGPLSPGV